MLPVELANTIMEKVPLVHSVVYFRMPIPNDRMDRAYFLPVKSPIAFRTKLFLGVVHPDDEAGTRKRLETAHAVYTSIAGVSTECGLGMTPFMCYSDYLNRS